MKKILKFITLFCFCLTLHQQFFGNLTFAQPLPSLLKTAAILTLFELLLKPLINLLLLPINFLTLGLIRFITNTLGLYLASFLLVDFRLHDFSFPGQSWQFNGFFAYLATALSLNVLLFFFRFIFSNKK